MTDIFNLICAASPLSLAGFVVGPAISLGLFAAALVALVQREGEG